ncbi:hypothetical protein GM921_09635 [Pedobacter sp. LMG 31464]|uniref:Inactive Receiver domain-containing protein n=1 Tax=Pedobacter planticolens TaxID=2679964 RepID=A0A923E1H3_9SPHI|nr:hypothetical protein [Pedobacter planticolens]MBB2145747.1 hypothetical protein [Pedobacter planticolens]
MESTFIINDSENAFTKKVISELKITPIDYYDLRDDIEIDRFVTENLKDKKVERLLIPTSLGENSDNNIGIRIGLHIRLSQNIGEKYLVPIIFISDRSLETLLLDQDNRYSLIAATQGSVLVGQDVEEIAAHLTHIRPADKNDFGSKVLNNLIIKGSETMGPHSLANEWGVIQFDKVANLASLLPSSPAYAKRSSLFFKYLSAKNRSKLISLGSPAAAIGTGPNLIPATGKKILYIDDEGYKGWTAALGKAFHGGTLAAITGEHLSEADFFAEISSKLAMDWDLILLDLRLLPLKEDLGGHILPIASYSGTKILKEIKMGNEGVQVIIFTASNKAWNMRDLQKLGADGYYIKESPEYLMPDHLSLENYNSFKAQVLECFAKVHLRQLYVAKENAKAQTVNTLVDFMAFSALALDEFFTLLKLDLRKSAFLSLFQIIELYAKSVISGSPVSVVDLNGVTVCIKIGLDYQLVFHQDAINGNYFEKAVGLKNPYKDSALGNISFVIAFKFGQGNVELRKVADLVKKRNDIAHTGTANPNMQDFDDLIGLITLFRSNS